MSTGGDDRAGGRLALPKNAFRRQPLAPADKPGAPRPPVVVTPDYEDAITTVLPTAWQENGPAIVPRRHPSSSARDRDPFKGYGQRSSSRPYALRLPDAIDLTLRQIAAEERIHPLRIIDRILYEHLDRTGRLPPIVPE